MLDPDDMHHGVVLRVINSHGLGAPVGSLATVQTVETSRTTIVRSHYQQMKTTQA
jgi:hypothetical protein